MTIIYQNRAMRAIRNCNLIMPTSFTTQVGRHKQFTLPGFVLAGELYGRLRTFYIIDDQIFVVKDDGQHHFGSVAKSCLERLHATRKSQFEGGRK